MMQYMTNTHAPTLVPYSMASAWFDVSIHALQRRVGDGRLTRYTDPRDERRTLLDLSELAQMFSTVTRPRTIEQESHL